MMSLIKYTFIAYFKPLCFSIILLSTLFLSNAHSKDFSEYDVKAVYLYNFLNFMSWPVDNQSKLKKICVFGTNPFGGVLDKLVKSKPQKDRIVIEYLNKLETIQDCHILFVGKSEEKLLKDIFNRLKKYSVLMVSDIPRFVYKGGMVGFTTDSERIKLKVNLKLVEEHGIKIDSNLLELSTIVNKSGG